MNDNAPTPRQIAARKAAATRAANKQTTAPAVEVQPAKRTASPADVERWVAAIRFYEKRGITYGGAAFREAKRERDHAIGKLASWGLDRDGNPKVVA